MESNSIVLVIGVIQSVIKMKEKIWTVIRSAIDELARQPIKPRRENAVREIAGLRPVEQLFPEIYGKRANRRKVSQDVHTSEGVATERHAPNSHVGILVDIEDSTDQG